MLLELRVRNLALIEDASVACVPGLNVLTGTTGAGKSLLLLALGLLAGGRWSREMQRTGSDRTEVEGVFAVESTATQAAVAELLDVPVEEAAEVVVRRRVDSGGRNRCEAGGRLVSVATLRDLGALLVEIHGQNEHQALLDVATQTSLLDRAAGLDEQREAFAVARAEWLDASRRLAALSDDAEARTQRLGELDALVAEVEALEIRDGEADALRNERELLAAAGRHGEAVEAARALIEEGGAGGAESAVDRIGAAAARVGDTAALSESAREAQVALDAALDSLQQAVRELAVVQSELDADPERLDEVQDRLEALGQLLRRHGPTETDALAAAERARDEAAALRSDDSDSGALEERVTALRDTVRTLGAALDDARRTAGAGFAERVREALAELDMPGMRFEVSVPERGTEPEMAATDVGLGPVQFVASPNRGEALKPLARIASGGETARVALAIKGELAGADQVPLLAFDEIDADVGARLGVVIGRRLTALADGRQVLVVTHLPQVAAYADRHLHVTKDSADERTRVRVEPLEGAEREFELAEMMRGRDHAGEALDQARAMLAEAGRSGAA